MLRLILLLIANILLVLGLSKLFPDFYVNNWWSAFWFVIVLTILHVVLVPFLQLISLPITFLTLGLFSLIINLIVLWLAINLVDGVGIVSTNLASRVITLGFVSVGLAIGQSLLNAFFKNE